MKQKKPKTLILARQIFSTHNEGPGCRREKDALKTSGETKSGIR